MLGLQSIFTIHLGMYILHMFFTLINYLEAIFLEAISNSFSWKKKNTSVRYMHFYSIWFT